MSDKKLLRHQLYAPCKEYVLICNGFSSKGSYRAEFHITICQIIYDYLFPDDEEYKDPYRGLNIHEYSSDITSFLDERIGLITHRELDNIELRNFTARFIELLISKLDEFKRIELESEKK